MQYIKFSYSRKICFPYMFLWTSTMQFREPSPNNWHKEKNVRRESKNKNKTRKFLEKRFHKKFIYTCRKCFWQNYKDFFTENYKNRFSISDKKKILPQNTSPEGVNDPLDTYSVFLTTTPNCLNCFPQRSASNYLIITFRSGKFSTIMFSVYIELICDSNAEKPLLKKWKRSSCFKFLKINSVFLKACSSGNSK